MSATSIAWTDVSWNPVTGCSKVSEGCRHCYAEAVAKRYWPHQYGARKFTDVRCHEDRLDHPLRWRKPRRVFVNSMSDLFHSAVPSSFIEQVLAVMAMAPQHTFQILTKRPERMRDLLRARGGETLANVWLGVSVEDQRAADERIPLLLDTPAAVRWLSCEPLLGPIDLECIREADGDRFCAFRPRGMREPCELLGIDWVVVGGESGPGHRPMDLAWARDIRKQCQSADVPFFFKQTSGPRPGIGTDALGEVVQEFPA